MRTRPAVRRPGTPGVDADAGHDQHPHLLARAPGGCAGGTRYGYTAEALQNASATTPPPHHRDPDVVETLGMIDQIESESKEVAGSERVVEVALTGERELLSAAVYDLLQHAVTVLSEACERFPRGPDDVPDLEQANRHVGDVLRVLRETELVSVQHPDRTG
jgi:hypothetical protein